MDENNNKKVLENFNTEYKDYNDYTAIMISTDRAIFIETSAVRARMIEYSKLYKELHIIVFSTNNFETVNLSENCKIYSTNSLTKLDYIRGAYNVGKEILKNIPVGEKVLFTCQDPFETGLVGAKLSSIRNGSELLLQIHTDLFSPYFGSLKIGFKNFILNNLRLFISRFTLPRANTIRVVSKKIADSLEKRGFSIEKIIVKPIEVNVDFFKNSVPAFSLKEKFPQFKKIVLMVSRLETEKNIDMAIRAVAKVIEQRKSQADGQVNGRGHGQNSDLGLVIVGSGKEMQKLKKLAYTLKIEAQVAFEGFQSDLIPYYKGCDIFLVTSWYEGYGMVFKEAQAAGCRIISTDVGIAREVGVEIVGWEVEDIVEVLNEI